MTSAADALSVAFWFGFFFLLCFVVVCNFSERLEECQVSISLQRKGLDVEDSYSDAMVAIVPGDWKT